MGETENQRVQNVLYLLRLIEQAANEGLITRQEQEQAKQALNEKGHSSIIAAIQSA